MVRRGAWLCIKFQWCMIFSVAVQWMGVMCGAEVSFMSVGVLDLCIRSGAGGAQLEMICGVV